LYRHWRKLSRISVVMCMAIVLLDPVQGLEVWPVARLSGWRAQSACTPYRGHGWPPCRVNPLRPAGWQSARQGFGMGAVARAARCHVNQVPRQHTVDAFRRERLLPHLAPSSSARERQWSFY
jgi:hypothetical protein